MATDEIGSKIKTFIRQRGSVKAKLTTFSKFLAEISIRIQNHDVLNIEEQYVELELRLTQCEKLLDEFNQVQGYVESLVDDDDLDRQFEEREKFTTDYYREIAKAKNILKQNEGESQSMRQNSFSVPNGNTFQQQQVRLPPIEVPKFTGNYESWLEFRETFLSLIHTNTTLNNIQKYHYLKASLLEGAAEVIASLEFSYENYEIAWELLNERYNNNRLLIQNHLKTIFNMEISGNKLSPKLLRNVVDNLSKHLKALKQLNQPTESWDTLIIFIVTSKLEGVIAREWGI